jgi:hypothetical protein
MNVRGRIVLSVGGLSLALGGLLLACSTTNNNYPPGESTSGQSCSQTEDCKSPLVCIDNVCQAGATTTTTTTTTDGGTGGDGAVGDGGTTTVTGPHLGLAGESCQTSKDCNTGLDCVATEDFGSVCEVVSLSLTPTGKTCGGQCNAASDCCELPVGLSVDLTNDAGIFSSVLSVHSCQDVLTALNGTSATCLGGSLNTFQKTACFYYETYCNCAAGTWACSTSHVCQYQAGCTESLSNTVGGCPSENRIGTALSTLCTIPSGQTSGTCGPPPTCTTASDCNGKAVTDTAGAVCTNGDCTCYTPTGTGQAGCYLTCQGNLDCPGGYTCDSATSLCKAAGCAMSADCVTSTGNTTAVCVSGACKIPCSTDYQCNAGATGDSPTTFSGNVCSSGYCTPLGCSSDNDCTSGSVNTFCVTPTPTGERSAITGTGSM